MPSMAHLQRPSLTTLTDLILEESCTPSVCVDVAERLFKSRQIAGALSCAEATARLLRRVIDSAPQCDCPSLIAAVRDVGQRLQTAQPQEIAIGNITSRVVSLIREESKVDRAHTDSTLSYTQHSQTRRVSATPGTHGQTSTTTESSASNDESDQHSLDQNLRVEVVEGIDELLDEIRQADDQIAGYALEHIHPNEIIMTYGFSLTVLKFLLKAAAKRKFTVISIEGLNDSKDSAGRGTVSGPASQTSLQGSLPSKTLGAAGITVIVAPDSAIFALCARTNMLLLSADAVFADGTFKGPSGIRMMIEAARQHRTSVLTLSSVWKISPIYPFADSLPTDIGHSPSNALSEVQKFQPDVHVEYPSSDLIPPSAVDLYITNIGGFPSASIRRVAVDHYRGEDIGVR